MTESLGIRIVGLDSGEYIIGIVKKSLEGDLLIKSPFVLYAEENKVIIKSYNEFSNRDIIINLLKWIDIQEPSNDLMKKYMSLADNIKIMDDVNNIDMESIIPPKKSKKMKKKRDIYTRWLDKM